MSTLVLTDISQQLTYS